MALKTDGNIFNRDDQAEDFKAFGYVISSPIRGDRLDFDESGSTIH